MKFRNSLRKDFLLLLHSPIPIVSLFTVSLTVILIFFISLEKPFPLPLAGVRSISWCLVFLLNFILVGQALYEERELGAIQINRSSYGMTTIFISKLVVLWVGESLVIFGIQLVTAILFQEQSLENSLRSFCILTLGSIPLLSLGIAFGLVSAEARYQELVLPLLQIPLSLPVFFLGRETEFRVLQRGDLYGLFLFLSLIVFYTALCLVLLEIVMGKGPISPVLDPKNTKTGEK